MKKKTLKSEFISFRFDPRTRFALDFLVRVRGQTLTRVMETAITEAANKATVGEKQKTWKNYWDVNDGVRFLNFMNDKDIFHSFDEEEQLEFIKMHSEYFYKYDNPNRGNLEVLWPSMPHLMELWNETKSTDRNKVQILMKEILEKANAYVEDKK